MAKNNAIIQNQLVIIQSQAASLRTLENQVAQLANALNNRPQGSLPSDTENPRRDVAAEFEKKCSTKLAEKDDLTDFEVNEDNSNRAAVRKSLQKNITKPVFSFPEFSESVLEPVVTEEDVEDAEEDGKED
ncbi:hypothetical protein TIFTF001_031687 [Ficus carica]|uniref:Uncharacterized protein n=1 Tax=Ficus carica TaxID=3494 RepID=A0AA88J1C6_FICCA|nr:hypothetical protein TIFTF001_031687 [Ficus carica]